MNPFRLFTYTGHYLSENFLEPRRLNIKHKSLLEKNKELKGSASGKRCFILAGGPSLKEMDLSPFKDEDTFVVNEFDSHPQFANVHPKNHLIVDTAYFTHPPDHFHTKSFLAKTQSIPIDTRVFLNVHAKDMVSKHNLFSNHTVHYVAMHGVYSDKFDFNIDIDSVVPWPKNSILMCLVIAVYMGFEKIYLLGCEHSFLATNIGLGKKLTYDHSYKDERENIDADNPEVVKKFTAERDIGLTYESQVSHVRQLFKNYRLFWQKVQKRYPRTQILNATPETFLDVFPLIDFEDIDFS